MRFCVLALSLAALAAAFETNATLAGRGLNTTAIPLESLASSHLVARAPGECVEPVPSVELTLQSHHECARTGRRATSFGRAALRRAISRPGPPMAGRCQAIPPPMGRTPHARWPPSRA